MAGKRRLKPGIWCASIAPPHPGSSRRRAFRRHPLRQIPDCQRRAAHGERRKHAVTGKGRRRTGRSLRSLAQSQRDYQAALFRGGFLILLLSRPCLNESCKISPFCRDGGIILQPHYTKRSKRGTIQVKGGRWRSAAACAMLKCKPDIATN